MAENVAAETAPDLLPVDAQDAGDAVEVPRVEALDLGSEDAAGVEELVGDQGPDVDAAKVLVAVVDEFDRRHAGGDGDGHAVAVIGCVRRSEAAAETDGDLALDPDTAKAGMGQVDVFDMDRIGEDLAGAGVGDLEELLHHRGGAPDLGAHHRAERARLLNAVLADVYGPQQLMEQGFLPPELVFAHQGFIRPCHGVDIPHTCYLHFYAADLARTPDGQWWVLADRAQSPAGAGYALENRLILSSVLSDLVRECHVQRLASFFLTVQQSLIDMAPRHRDNPRIVLLTPGPYNETYFEHAYLARYLGYTLAEGADLTVRDQAVYLRHWLVCNRSMSFCDAWMTAFVTRWK